MKEVIINKKKEKTIDFIDIDDNAPIFAKRNDKLCGMLVKEDKGWVLKIGKAREASGHFEALIVCIKSCTSCGYTFFVN